MSSLSTLPKGDSAWLLRKSIQRVMQQVSVLETNIGSSTTGNSANTQIIFNDAGTLRGDAQFTWNKTLNRLTVDGDETITGDLTINNAATISGDLTVDTSTLKVDSTNNRVGIGTASPLNAGHIQGAGQATVTPTVTGDGSALSLIDSQTVANNGGMLVLGSICSNGNFGQVGIKSLLTNGLQNGTSDLAFFTRAAVANTTLSERYRIAQDGVATWSNVGGVAGTAMTLNSTGLGIGGPPNTGFLTVGSTSNVSATTNALTILSQRATFVVTANGATDAAGTTINYAWASGGQGPLIFRNASIANVMTLDASGNVGVGVTPSQKLDVFSSTGCVARIRGGSGAGQSAAFYVSNTAGTSTLAAFGDGANMIGGAVDSSAMVYAGASIPLVFYVNSAERMRIDSAGNVISNVTGTAPTLATNSQMVFNLTSNTNLRISVRGTDGTTRTANITLA